MSVQRTARRASIPRHIRPGTPRTSRAGEELSCVVLASGNGEWVGVDLRSGALVRNDLGSDSANLLQTAPLDVCVLALHDDVDPVDPARPEAIVASVRSVGERQLRKRAFRRLMRQLSAPEIEHRPMLRTRGPSIAYVDLDGRKPSLDVIPSTAKRLEVMTDASGVVSASIDWGGTTQILPVVDPRVETVARRHAPRSLTGRALQEALGWKPGYAVVGLANVRDGHVKKVMLALLER